MQKNNDGDKNKNKEINKESILENVNGGGRLTRHPRRPKGKKKSR